MREKKRKSVAAWALLLALSGSPATAESWLGGLHASSKTLAVAPQPDGSTLMLTTSGSDVLIARLDAEGKTLEQVRFGDGISLEAVGAGVTADGGLLLAAKRTTSPFDTMVGSVSPSGTWRWGVDLNLAGGFWPRGLTELSDGATALVGHDQDQKLTVLLLEPDGSPRDAKIFHGIGVQDTDRFPPHRLASSADGGFILMGKTDDTSGRADGQVVRFDSEGSMAWRRLVRLESPAEPGGLVIGPDGSVLLQFSPEFLDFVQLIELDADGELIAEHSVDFGHEVLAADISRASDGRIALLADAVDGGALALVETGGSQVEAWSLGVRVASQVEERAPGLFVVAGSGTPSRPVTSAVLQLDTASAVPAACFPIEAIPVSVAETADAVILPASFAFTEASIETESLTLHPTGGGASPACDNCPTDDHEPDDECGTGLPLDITAGGTPTSLNFCQDGEDWFHLDTCAGQRVTIETASLGASADTVLEIFDEDCNVLLASDDDGGGGRASSLTWMATGKAQLRIRQVDGTFGTDRSYDVSAILAEDPSADLAHVQVSGLTARGHGALTSDGGYVFAGVRGTFGPGSEFERFAIRLNPDGSVNEVGLDPGNTSFSWVLGATHDGETTVLLSDVPDDSAPGVPISRLTWLDANLDFVRAMNFPDSFNAHSLVSAGAGGVVVFGKHGDRFGAPLSDFAWLAVDESGALTDVRTLDVVPSDLELRGHRDANGGLVLLGRSESATMVTRLLPDGTVAWAFDIGAGQSNVWREVRATADGGALLAWSVAGDPFPTNNDVYLARFDTSGDLLWERGLDLSSRDVYGALSVLPDGSVLLGGERHGSSFNQPTAFLAHVLADGSLDWVRLANVEAGSLTDIAPRADGSLVLTGLSRPGAGASESFILTVLADGSSAEVCEAFYETPGVLYDSSELELVDLAVTVVSESLTTSPAAVTTEAHPAPDALTCDCHCRTVDLVWEISAPEAATPVRVEKSGRVSWEPPSESGACQHDLLRGWVSDLRNRRPAGCLAGPITGSEWTDAELPGMGNCYYYLVVGKGEHGGRPTEPGWSSTGRRREIWECR